MSGIPGFWHTAGMTRLLFALAGVALLAVTALGVLWLAGELLVGAGLLAVGTAGILLKLLWFLLVVGVLGGLTYFVASAWRPARSLPRPVARQAATGTSEPSQVMVFRAEPRLSGPDTQPTESGLRKS